jgi:hypothetical protein
MAATPAGTILLVAHNANEKSGELFLIAVARATATSAASSGSSGSKAGAVVGALFGVVGGIALIGAGFVYLAPNFGFSVAGKHVVPAEYFGAAGRGIASGASAVWNGARGLVSGGGGARYSSFGASAAGVPKSAAASSSVGGYGAIGGESAALSSETASAS